MKRDSNGHFHKRSNPTDHTHSCSFFSQNIDELGKNVGNKVQLDVTRSSHRTTANLSCLWSHGISFSGRESPFRCSGVVS